MLAGMDEPGGVALQSPLDPLSEGPPGTLETLHWRPFGGAQWRILLVSGLLVWMSGLYFGCPDFRLVCLILFACLTFMVGICTSSLGVWTPLQISGLLFEVSGLLFGVPGLLLWVSGLH